MIIVRDKQAALFSLGIVAFGVYVILEGMAMSMGTLRRIGPGFFPVVLGIVLTCLGAATLFERAQPRRSLPDEWRALICVLLAILSFGFLVRSTGMIPAIAALVLLTSLGQRQPSLFAAIVTFVALSLIGYGVFVLGLRIPVEPFSSTWIGMRR